MSKTIQQLAAEERKKSAMRTTVWSVIAVVVVIATIIGIKVAANDSGSASATSDSAPISADLFKAVTTIPESVFTTVGQGSDQSLPQVISAPALTQDNKPKIVYYGAEYCPYCAAERWPMVIALSRFGTFSNLRTSHSSTTDVFPNTQTFSFHGSSYTSQYIAFTGVETLSNTPQGNSYATLDTPTAEESQLVATYDNAPYVPSSSAGSIPFIYFGGKYLITGASYGPDTLQGKSLTDIAAALTDTGSDISKAIIGTANTVTAAICTMTNNQPGSVCDSPTIQTLIATLTH